MTQTRKEILEQPDVLAKVINKNWAVAQECAKAIKASGANYVYLAARGTSDHAGLYAKYLLAAANGLPVALATPSLFTYYNQPPRLDNALVIGISQSGASTDIVEVISYAHEQKALTLAITNDEQSALAKSADFTLPCLAGEEKAVAATKTYTSELLNIALLSLALDSGNHSLDEVKTVPDAVAQAIKLEAQIEPMVERYRYMQACVVLGRGYNFSTANEVALKTKEMAYVLTQPYSPADFMHGPLASIYEGFPVIAVVTSGALQGNLLDSYRTVRDRGAELIVISDCGEALALGKTGFRIPSLPEWLSPIPAIIPGQWFALNLALSKGYDPDHPRALHKVTLTR